MRPIKIKPHQCTIEAFRVLKGHWLHMCFISISFMLMAVITLYLVNASGVAVVHLGNIWGVAATSMFYTAVTYIACLAALRIEAPLLLSGMIAQGRFWRFLIISNLFRVHVGLIYWVMSLSLTALAATIELSDLNLIYLAVALVAGLYAMLGVASVLSMMIPAVLSGNGRSIRKAWKVSKGNIHRIALVILTPIVVLNVAQQVIGIVYELDADPASRGALIALTIASTVIYEVWLMAGICVVYNKIQVEE